MMLVDPWKGAYTDGTNIPRLRNMGWFGDTPFPDV
jgi:hypothetical protein